MSTDFTSFNYRAKTDTVKTLLRWTTLENRAANGLSRQPARPAYAVHHLFFLAAYRLWPFQTDRLLYCVGMCQEHLKRRWGNAYFNQCIISRAQSNFFWSHSDSCLFWPTIFFLACVCVRSTWRGVQAIPIWIHVWSAAHDPFQCCHIQTPAFADRPFLFFRVNVSRAGEEAFRRCLFEWCDRCLLITKTLESPQSL